MSRNIDGMQCAYEWYEARTYYSYFELIIAVLLILSTFNSYSIIIKSGWYILCGDR